MARPRPHVRPSTRRGGFSMVEVLLVIGMVGVIAAIALPRARAFREASAVRATRLELVTAIEAARAASLQRGRLARVRVWPDSARVTADTGGVGGPTTGQFTVLAMLPFKAQHQVSVTLASPADTTVTFDSRGLTSPRLAATRVYVLTRGSARDSVCVSRLGTILPPRCTA